MKQLLYILLITLGISSMTLASTVKVCFGSTQSNDTKGVVLKATIDNQKIQLKIIKTSSSSNFGSDFYDGKKSFPTLNQYSKGKDGKTYLQYLGANSDYQDIIMVDIELLKTGSTGLLQIRARGEGFFNDVFVCKDDTPFHH